MKLHSLELTGFGPFRETQVVDFDAFDGDGVFLISGRTGAGKSSILDAVCFGLYGGVPRYESGDKRLRSDHCEPDDLSEVVVEFSTAAGRFRVTRSPEYQRPAKRGTGLTKQAAIARLEELVGDEWIGRAARAVDVAGELDAILQLSQQQFLQVILLAQNRFARFLLADSKERQALLRRLFNTERFEDVQARFDERRRASEQTLGAQLASVHARVDEAERVITDHDLWGGDGAPDGAADAATPTTVEERLEALRRALARAQYRAERSAAERDDAEKRLTAADEALADVREQRQAQVERDRARAALAALDREEPAIVEARQTLERARAAEGLRSTIAAATRAEAARAASERVEVAARETWDETGVALEELSAAGLQVWAAERTRSTGAWERAVTLEEQTDERAEELAALRATVDAATETVQRMDVERAALPTTLAALTEERDTLRRSADRADDVERRRTEASARRDAAREVERLSAEQRDAERALADASAEHAAAQSTLAALRQRRLDGYAGELASALEQGAPCAVCGSTEHPKPAVHADPVSADDIAAAEAIRDTAAATERTASEHSAALRAEVAAATTRADGRSVEQAEAELDSVTAELDRIRADAERLRTVDRDLQEAQARRDAIERDLAEAQQALADARQGLTVREQQDRDAAAQIAEARGEHATVAERLAQAAAHIEAATALASAMLDTGRQREAARTTAAERDAVLEASPFADADEAEAALRTPEEQKALDARITAHAVQRETEKAILLPLEMRALPEEPIELAPAEEAAAAARAAWVEAVDTAGRTAAAAERLADLIASAADAHARSAAQAADHEILRGLADTIAGRGANTHKMTLETFVLAAELEEIVEAANRRLSDMSTGRYQLQHSDALAARGAASGLGIVVFDAFTGQTRPAQSLSGGETFLSSLALALGLAEVVTARAGGIQLDTLFIDEGFGSLDGDTLEVAMRTLDELRQGGRTVGVISHVEAMQEQIPAQLTVEATANGPSVIRA